MAGFFSRRLTVLAVGVILLAGCGPKGTSDPVGPITPEDPITRITVPGAYGVSGGDQTVHGGRQSSTLFFDNTFTFRILEPSTLTVASLSGIPSNLKQGEVISLQYRLAKGGRTVKSELYENVEILVISDKMAWLKKNEQIFFVVPLFQGK